MCRMQFEKSAMIRDRITKLRKDKELVSPLTKR